MKFTDRANIGNVKHTQEGYLVTQARAMRTGVQVYNRNELGLSGTGTVRVYRPEESVRDAGSLQSMAHAPVTIGHPDVEVTSENWKDYAVGEVSTAAMWDGDFISLPLILKDAAAIRAVNDGTAELSAGYIADMTPIEHADYDYIMGPPKYNHLAIVDRARAGSKARIGDNAYNEWGAAPSTDTKEKEVKMTDLKTVVVGDEAVNIAVADADAYKLTKMINDHKSVIAEKDATIAELKIQCADATKLIKTPEEIAAMISDGITELAEVADKARQLVKDYDATGKSAMDIRKEVIGITYGDEAVADFKTDAEINAAFKIARVADKADAVRGALKDAKPKKKEGEGNWDFITKKGDK